jgi:hypothetical protein
MVQIVLLSATILSIKAIRPVDLPVNKLLFRHFRSVLIRQVAKQTQPAISTHHMIQHFTLFDPVRLELAGDHFLQALIKHLLQMLALTRHPVAEQTRLVLILTNQTIQKVHIAFQVHKPSQTLLTARLFPAAPVEVTKRFEAHAAALLGQERALQLCFVAAVRQRLQTALTKQVVLIRRACVVGRVHHHIQWLVLRTLATHVPKRLIRVAGRIHKHRTRKFEQ